MKKALSIRNPEIQTLALLVVALGVITFLAYVLAILNGGNFNTLVNV